MKTWNYALYISIVSLLILIIIGFLPGHYSVFIWSKAGGNVGKLFPVMFFIWTLSLVAFAMNNIFVDKYYIDNHLQMRAVHRYLPSILSIPVFMSFIWFVFTWLKGNPLS